MDEEKTEVQKKMRNLWKGKEKKSTLIKLTSFVLLAFPSVKEEAALRQQSASNIRVKIIMQHAEDTTRAEYKYYSFQIGPPKKAARMLGKEEMTYFFYMPFAHLLPQCDTPR